MQESQHDYYGWERLFVDAENELRDKIITFLDFKDRLKSLICARDCPIEEIKVSVNEGKENIFEIAVDNGDENKKGRSLKTDQQIGDGQIVCHLSIDYISATPINNIYVLTNFFSSFLKINFRKKGHVVLDAKHNLVSLALEKAAEKFTPGLKGNFPALVYVDLDNFKEVNDNLDHVSGDDVLRVVEQHMNELATSVNFIPLSDGGDEYLLLFPDSDDFEILSAIHELRSRVKSDNHGPNSIRVDFTAGVARPSAEKFQKLNLLKKEAEKITKKISHDCNARPQKKRGTISFSSVDLAASKESNVFDFIKLGASIIRSCYNLQNPFANQALNFISYVTCNIIRFEKQVEIKDRANSINRVVEELLAWFGTKINPGSHCEEHLIGRPLFSATQLSSVEVILAIAHGIYRSNSDKLHFIDRGNINLAISIPNEAERDFCLYDSVSDVDIYKKRVTGSSSIAIGGYVSVEGECMSPLPLIAILQIGLSHKIKTPSGANIPSKLFAGIAVVDDRPHSGGGLPDFWQAAISKLAAVYSSSSNTVRKLVVVGDKNSAPETIQRLVGEKNVRIEEISALANRSGDEIKTFLSWAKAQIEYATTAEIIIESLYSSALQLGVINAEPDHCQRKKTISLKRMPAMNTMALQTSEGLCCPTPIEAYPAILDCLRHSSESALTCDDANQEMYELLGFKLLVEVPENNSLPDYWYEEKQSFDQYAKNVLIDQESLIGSIFYSDGQFEQFISHLTEYFKQSQGKTSTRRAVLVIPNKSNLGLQLSPKPLGLISIWATPRRFEHRNELVFCFVWRTVEALVGFPYSFYGSVKFAHHVISTINERFSKNDSFRQITLGPFRYIALSLHMRVDDYHRRFAKRIVDAASD